MIVANARQGEGALLGTESVLLSTVLDEGGMPPSNSDRYAAGK